MKRSLALLSVLALAMMWGSPSQSFPEGATAAEFAEWDPIFPIRSANKAFERVKRAYEIAGAPEAVIHDIHGGKHEFRSEVPMEWFDQCLPLPEAGDQAE